MNSKVTITTLSILLLLTGFLPGCAEESPRYPEVSNSDAVLAMEDVLLMSGTSMFLLFEAESSESGSITNDSDSLTLEWSGVDSEGGSGTYTVTLTEHTIGNESVFASDYNGYTMTGSIVLASEGPGMNTMSADLELTHESPEEFPVRRLIMELSGSEEIEGRSVPSGSLSVNDKEIDLALMSAAFD